MGKGLFTRVGFVLLKYGKVVEAKSPDVFLCPGEKMPERVLTKTDQAVATTSKMTCQIGPVRYISSEKIDMGGLKPFIAPEGLKMTVSLENAGPKVFDFKDDAADGIVGLLLIELYDTDGVLLFRENYVRYHSRFSFDPAKWPVLSVPSGRRKSEEFVFRPDEEFGPLPSGRYSVRVYFPFENERNYKYYPSNLLSFDWREGDRVKKKSK